MQALGNYLASTSSRSSTQSNDGAAELVPTQPIGGYDVCCLQEVWVKSDGDLLKRRARESGLVHGRWFHSYVLSLTSMTP